MKKKKKIDKQIKSYLKQGDELYSVKEPIALVSYCGYRDNEHPQFFLWRTRRFEVKRALASWKVEEQDHPGKRIICYRVESVDGIIFDCSYDELSERWILLGTDLAYDAWPKLEKE